jgi:hypothetical protein
VRPRRKLLLWSCALLALLSGIAAAQDSKQEAKKEARLRSVLGVVTDKSDKPVANAIVFLKNLRTNVVISHFSDAQGNYRFTGLDPNADYELRAEVGGEKSASRTISSLDSRKEMNLNLKIDRKR